MLDKMEIFHNKLIDYNIDLDEYSTETNRKFSRTIDSDKVLQWQNSANLRADIM